MRSDGICKNKMWVMNYKTLEYSKVWWMMILDAHCDCCGSQKLCHSSFVLLPWLVFIWYLWSTGFIFHVQKWSHCFTPVPRIRGIDKFHSDNEFNKLAQKTPLLASAFLTNFDVSKIFAKMSYPDVKFDQKYDGVVTEPVWPTVLELRMPQFYA